MKRLALTAVFVLAMMTSFAQDVVAAYNVTPITSYIRIDSITHNTFSVLRDSIASLRHRYHSANFVVDMLHTKGGYGVDAVMLADSMSTCPWRFGILIGPRTEGGAQQTAMFLRRAGKAALFGNGTPDGLTPDIALPANDSYLTQWYDSIQRANVVSEAAEKYAATHPVRQKYSTANDFLINFLDNAVLIDYINEIASDKGIKADPDAFFYSGYMILSQARAEIVRKVYPDDPQSYYKACGVPIQQAVEDVASVLESAQYRSIVSGKGE